MSQTLVQKTLSDGGTLQLKKYQLSQEAAVSLRRPVGSDEMVLTLDTKHGGGTTVPRASWYLGEEDFKKLYEAIRNEGDFERVYQFLDDEVKSSLDAQKVGSFLEKF